jgi:hypothetical protein
MTRPLTIGELEQKIQDEERWRYIEAMQWMRAKGLELAARKKAAPPPDCDPDEDGAPDCDPEPDDDDEAARTQNKTQLCPKCRGSGNNSGVSCGRCKGTGRISVDDKRPEDKNSSSLWGYLYE